VVKGINASLDQQGESVTFEGKVNFAATFHSPRWGSKTKEKNDLFRSIYHGLAPRGYYQTPLRG